jgi:hypothetical protein
MKELKDFRSSISTLPGASTCRANPIHDQKSPKATKLYRNLLTSYEKVNIEVVTWQNDMEIDGPCARKQEYGQKGKRVAK